MGRMIQIIHNSLVQGESVVMATVISDSAQGHLAGAKMLVWANGNSYGTTGGGLLEAEVLKAATSMFAEKTNRIRVLVFPGETDTYMKHPCGEGIKVFIEHIPANAENIRIFQKLLTSQQNGTKSTLLASVFTYGENHKKYVQRAVVCADGSTFGEVQCPDEFLPDLLKKTHSVSLPVLEHLSENCFFIDPWIIPPTVYLFGAGHIAQEVVELTAKAGFRVIVLDDRAKFANKERFPMADDIVALDSFENCLAGLAINEESYVVVVTRGHRYDKTVLRQALRTHAGYIGIVGSMRKRDSLFKELLCEGFSVDELIRVYFPIGIDIHAETPVEISVSIVSQLILLRARKTSVRKQQIRRLPALQSIQWTDNHDEKISNMILKGENVPPKKQLEM